MMCCLEVSVKKNSRPEKRKGGGGYGHYKNFNNAGGSRDVRKASTYRQPNKGRKGGPDRRQFSR